MSADASNMIWIDLEMTGLDPDRCFIMEIASLVTDSELEVIAEGPNLIVHNTDAQLESLSDWCKDHFGKSGLIDRVRASTVLPEEAEAQTLAFLEQHCLPGVAPLCGNSVHNDRAFLWRHMRRLHDFVHYRNVDVSTLKDLLSRWFPADYAPPPKQETHEALLDIRESVEELRYYRTFLRSPAARG